MVDFVKCKICGTTNLGHTGCKTCGGDPEYVSKKVEEVFGRIVGYSHPKDRVRHMISVQANLIAECSSMVGTWKEKTPAQLGNAISAEGVELWENEGNSTPYGAWWKPPAEDLHEAQIKEAMDILHFWLQLVITLDMTPDEIFIEYLKVIKENIRRYVTGERV